MAKVIKFQKARGVQTLLLGNSVSFSVISCRKPFTFICIFSSLKTAENVEVMKTIPSDRLLIETGKNPCIASSLK